MQRWAELDVEAGGYSVQLENDGSSVALNWQKTPPPYLPFTAPPAKPFSFDVGKHWSPASKEWFPLPSYLVSSPESPHAVHNLKIPHWFLLLVYVGLWQLPWLVRYHRRRRIERSQATVPAAGA